MPAATCTRCEIFNLRSLPVLGVAAPILANGCARDWPRTHWEYRQQRGPALRACALGAARRASCVRLFILPSVAKVDGLSFTLVGRLVALQEAGG